MNKKNYLVVGASSEIGLVVCRNLLKKGHNLISHVNTRISRMNSLNKEYPGKLTIFKQDFNNSNESIEEVFPLKDLNSIDGIVHCPSPAIEIKHIFKTPWTDFENHLNVQIKSLHNILQFLNNSKLLNNTKLVIVNSELSIIKKLPKGYSAYGCSKITLDAYCSFINEDINNKKLIVNQVSPGMFDSKLLRNLPAYLKEFSEENKINHESDILEVIDFLLFRASDKVKNQNIHISSE
jgi:short-subunit dehydrogenase